MPASPLDYSQQGASLRCVRVGHGTAAAIHASAFQRIGVQTLAVVEPDPAKQQELRGAGIACLGSCRDAMWLTPDFWDVCTPTASHAQVVAEIISGDPEANILVEKPVCDFADIPHLEEALAEHRGKLVINENYCSSAVTSAVRDLCMDLELEPTSIVVEMTKHRGGDYRSGRFVDMSLGALGYEGSHLLTVVEELGTGHLANQLLEIELHDLRDEDGSEGEVRMRNQGGAHVRYTALSGSTVELYTSMTGVVGYPHGPYAPPNQRIDDDDGLTRYRIVRVDGHDPRGTRHHVVGFFEPAFGLNRGEGAVAWFRDSELTYLQAPLPDHTMKRHFERALSHFAGAGVNPCPVDRALRTARQLHEWAASAKARPAEDLDVLQAA